MEDDFSLLENCSLCPRMCHANRLSGEKGYCGAGAGLHISSICIHKGEEPALGGKNGICNVFFSNCNLSCIYCQNFQISCKHDALEEVLDMDQVMAYAKQKNVKILLWLAAATMERQMIEALDLYEKWGIAGIKVDFMNRDDQVMMNFYEKVMQETAKRHMVVNFHGTCKSTGLRRTYPNLLTQEGLIEFEFSGCSDWDNPDHHNTLPFLRNVSGPMDYIPGTFNNVVKKDFRIVGDYPMGMGTRAHFIAMAVTTMSPMQMIPDAPSDYEREPECAKFLLSIPTVWDETRVFDAKMGDYLVVARRNNKDWYLAATTDWSARDLTFDFSFLPAGTFTLDLVRDGINADIRAIDYKMETIKVTKETKLKVHLAPGGGWVGRIR